LTGPTSTGEVKLSAVAFPIVQSNPQQDPIISNCYMDDDNITSDGSTRFVTWGDNRNVVTITGGVTENQPDVFLQSYSSRDGEATTRWPPFPVSWGRRAVT
jgi:hypothetical protein